MPEIVSLCSSLQKPQISLAIAYERSKVILNPNECPEMLDSRSTQEYSPPLEITNKKSWVLTKLLGISMIQVVQELIQLVQELVLNPTMLAEISTAIDRGEKK